MSKGGPAWSEALEAVTLTAFLNWPLQLQLHCLLTQRSGFQHSQFVMIHTNICLLRKWPEWHTVIKRNGDKSYIFCMNFQNYRHAKGKIWSSRSTQIIHHHVSWGSGQWEEITLDRVGDFWLVINIPQFFSLIPQLIKSTYFKKMCDWRNIDMREINE